MHKRMTIYTDNTFITIVGPMIDTTVHKHYSHQITISLECCSFIPSMTEHQLNTDKPFAVILVNPISNDGRYLSTIKEVIDFHLPAEGVKLGIETSLSAVHRLYHQIIDLLLPTKPQLSEIDERIHEAITLIDTLDIKKISAQDLANEVFLSESRLAHLFKLEIGVPLRRYLLWLKLKDAIELIPQSKSFTDAAHMAGFADSAHLARTCKNQFGLDLTHIFDYSRFIQVVINNH